jgi:hypothetical protein
VNFGVTCVVNFWWKESKVFGSDTVCGVTFGWIGIGGMYLLRLLGALVIVLVGKETHSNKQPNSVLKSLRVYHNYNSTKQTIYVL